MTQGPPWSDPNPYAPILDDFDIITVDHWSENDLGCAAFATRALLAARSPVPFRDQRMDQLLRSFGPSAERSTFRAAQRAVGPPPGWTPASPTILLHEGYAVDPANEGAAEIEKMRANLGPRFWACAPEVWGAWGRKTVFRERCRDLLGVAAIPGGVELETAELSHVLAAVGRVARDAPGPVVVKLPATGGAGNVVLGPDSRAWPGELQSAWTERYAPSSPCDVVVESWLPWTTTYSVSFLVAPDAPPTLLAACEQVIDPTTSDFVGSRSSGPLEAADLDTMLSRLQPVFTAMRDEGYAGVAAVDVIIGPGRTWAGRGLALPSGLRMCLIECNPRFNQHNRVGLVVARLARHWGVQESDLRWTLRYVYPREPDTVESLCSTGEPETRTDLPARPEGTTPVRRLFAHRLDLVMELTIDAPWGAVRRVEPTVRRAGSTARRWSGDPRRMPVL